MGPLTLVTGASGFIGRRLCEEIVVRGGAVRALVRVRTSLPSSVEQFVAADLFDAESIRRALHGVHTVMHFAARVHQLRDDSPNPLYEYRRVNVEGTRILLEQARRAGVMALVLASSVKAVVGHETDLTLDETTPANPGDAYGTSKLEAEHLVHEFSGFMRTTVLRLPLAYGPGVKANMLQLIRVIDRGLPLPFGAVKNRRSLVFSGNVADAAIKVATTPAAAGQTFFVSDGQPVSMAELVRAIAYALGRPARLIPVPTAVFRMAARMGDAISSLVPLPLNSAAVERLVGSLAVDSRKLREITGWSPPHTLAEGLSETASWYRAISRNS